MFHVSIYLNVKTTELIILCDYITENYKDRKCHIRTLASNQEIAKSVEMKDFKFKRENKPKRSICFLTRSFVKLPKT